VLASGERGCCFCDSTEVLLSQEAPQSARASLAAHRRVNEEWRGELNQRLQAYRAKRRRTAPNEAQHALPFDDRVASPSGNAAVEMEGRGVPARAPADDFAFTIAIGRTGNQEEVQDPSLLIDVSVPPEGADEPAEPKVEPVPSVHTGLFPVASLDDRRRALLIDAACLAFAYGGFLALFGSLGGHFAFNKLSAAVCFFSFAFVYLQYFGLFTIFGGSTPGMMIGGLQVASFSGDVPTPGQYMLRAVGYLLSAGTCFLGFLWVLWDEDGLTWHDRMSNTYLAPIETFVESDFSHPAAAR
jgi:uncharacterized RDD family membrane protein YckC